MQDDGNGNAKMPKAACAELQTKNTPLVSEGIEYLQKAIDLRPSYDEAMSYINLVYRRKADLECGNDEARKADLDQADAWRDKSMGTRKANEEKKNEADSWQAYRDEVSSQPCSVVGTSLRTPGASAFSGTSCRILVHRAALSEKF